MFDREMYSDFGGGPYRDPSCAEIIAASALGAAILGADFVERKAKKVKVLGAQTLQRVSKSSVAEVAANTGIWVGLGAVGVVLGAEYGARKISSLAEKVMTKITRDDPFFEPHR